MRIKQYFLFLIMPVMFLFSCGNVPDEPTDLDEDLVEITRDQFMSEKMKLGSPTHQPFAEKVHFAGMIVPGVNGIANISLSVPGVIKRILCKPGQQVRKGAGLFEISGNELVDLQRDFAESSAILRRLKSDYDRAKTLRGDNIGSQKEFIAVESAFYAENAKYSALKIKIEAIGLQPAAIESGTMSSVYLLRSPLDGYVVSVDATIGQFVDPQHTIAELVDAGSFQLKLSVFERNVHKVKVGQSFSFYLNGDQSISYSGKISTVGMQILNTTKSVECFGAIQDMGKVQMVNNQFVEGEIFLAVDSALSIPQTACITSGEETFVLMLVKETEQGYFFQKTRIIPGRKNKDLVELKNQLTSGKLLMEGLYNIQIE